MNLLQYILIPSALAAGPFTAGINAAADIALTEGLSTLTIEDLPMTAYIWLGLLVSSLALFALVWGGIGYILAFGNEAGIAKAKKTIVYAAIGLMVAGSIELIRWLVLCELLKTNIGGICKQSFDLAEGLLVMINVLLAPAGAMAFGALIYGAYLFMTSSGDESRASKAKKVILYALVGLAVIGISGIIVNVFINILIL